MAWISRIDCECGHKLKSNETIATFTMTSVSTPYMLLQFVVLSSASMMACLAQKDASSNIIRNIRGGVRDAGWSKEGVRAGEDNEDFDYYVYSMCSLPDYCKENDGRFPGCHVFDASWEGNLTIHGLWPNVRTSFRRLCETPFLSNTSIFLSISSHALCTTFPTPP